MATSTPNLGLNVVPSADYTKYFDEWRKEMASDEDSSNMMKIDAAVGALNDDVAAVKSGKQDKLTFDSSPVSGSENPVTSGGVYDALSGKDDAGAAAAVQANLGTHAGNTDLHVTAAKQAVWNAKQDALGGLNGILKATGSGVEAAEAGTDYASPALNFVLTLSVSGWSNNQQTVSDANIILDGHDYVVTPKPSTYEEYAGCLVRAEDVTTAGKMTFTCDEVPETDVYAYVMRLHAQDA